MIISYLEGVLGKFVNKFNTVCYLDWIDSYITHVCIGWEWQEVQVSIYM